MNRYLKAWLKNKLRQHFKYFVFIFLWAACNTHPNEQTGEKPVARVYDSYLYEKDLKGIGKGAATADDSIQAVKSYIDSWIRHELLVHYAEMNLPEDAKNLDQQLNDYRQSLIIYLYEKNLIDQKMDTVVTSDDINTYYKGSKADFELQNGIAKFRYFILNKNANVNIDSAVKWLRAPSPFNVPQLTGFCREHAAKFAVKDSAWYNKDAIQSLLPSDRFDLDDALGKNKLVQVNDADFMYVVKFDSFYEKGKTAPLNFVRNDIRNIILNKRKLAFIDSLQKSIFNDAENRNAFETY